MHFQHLVAGIISWRVRISQHRWHPYEKDYHDEHASCRDRVGDGRRPLRLRNRVFRSRHGEDGLHHRRGGFRLVSRGRVTTPESCPNPWPLGSPDRNNGNATAFSERSPMDEGC
jgi:hypothetical protein